MKKFLLGGLTITATLLLTSTAMAEDFKSMSGWVALSAGQVSALAPIVTNTHASIPANRLYEWQVLNPFVVATPQAQVRASGYDVNASAVRTLVKGAGCAFDQRPVAGTTAAKISAKIKCRTYMQPEDVATLSTLFAAVWPGQNQADVLRIECRSTVDADGYTPSGFWACRYLFSETVANDDDVGLASRFIAGADMVQ